ncbi:hypothetical protein CEXT_794401 [Caerostris extrusa]|uniref:Uncharacterized protein n=1 Tax=Caerostris extrusa TaxID=172846 RepID=A0AAV4Y128_CAEEX|nr:hypothetical protein CEXT_794401 [Caerostris extrusa]
MAEWLALEEGTGMCLAKALSTLHCEIRRLEVKEEAAMRRSFLLLRHDSIGYFVISSRRHQAPQAFIALSQLFSIRVRHLEWRGPIRPGVLIRVVAPLSEGALECIARKLCPRFIARDMETRGERKCRHVSLIPSSSA